MLFTFNYTFFFQNLFSYISIAIQKKKLQWKLSNCYWFLFTFHHANNFQVTWKFHGKLGFFIEDEKCFTNLNIFEYKFSINYALLWKCLLNSSTHWRFSMLKGNCYARIWRFVMVLIPNFILVHDKVDF